LIKGLFKPKLLVLFGIILFFYVGCGGKFGFGTVSWKQKVTVEVETPDGVKTGSAVTKITKKDHSGFLVTGMASGIHSDVEGEAVVVDLGGGKYLFALLDNIEYLAFNSLWDEVQKKGRGKKIYKNFDGHRILRDLKNIKAAVPEKRYPDFLTFSNPEDPNSIVRLDHKDLERTFGESYRFLSMKIEIVDEPVTWGRLEKFFPYFSWSPQKRHTYWGNPKNPSIAITSNPLSVKTDKGTIRTYAKYRFIRGE